MSLDVNLLRSHVIRPTLSIMADVEPAIQSEAAENLLIGTAATESGLTSIVQRNGGPARGLWQVEPRTEDDTWRNFLAYRPELGDQIKDLIAGGGVVPAGDLLALNHCYCCAMARLVYWRQSDPLPPADDPVSMAAYWKDHYNSKRGLGEIRDFTRAWHSLVKGKLDRSPIGTATKGVRDA